jgi:predicted nuclease with TOPRIM domain
MPRGKHGGGEPPIRFPNSAGDPVSELLADPLLDPATKLKDILRQVERAHDEWTAAERACDELVEGSEKLRDAQDHVRTAYRRWHALAQEAKEAEEEVRRRSLEIPRSGDWQEMYATMVSDLKQQYDGLGPHYDLLCEHTASLTVRLRMMEASGRDVSSGEYVEMHKLYLGYVNQLQKYTEAMKSESISKMTQEVAEQIVQLFERHFGTLHPEEWDSAVRELTVMVRELAA